MYFAQFGLGNATYLCAALRWVHSNRAGFSDTLLGWILAPNVENVGCRVAVSRESVEVTLLLSSARASRASLETICQSILSTCSAPGDARLGENAEEFDQISARFPRHRMWLNQRGYTSGELKLAPDFRIFPLNEQFAAVALERREPFVYQINLQRRSYEREEERRIRKYLAAVELNTAFPQSVRDLQLSLGRRFFSAGYLIDEFVGFDSDKTLADAHETVLRYFRETMGRFGFQEPPLDSEGFDDLLFSGLHSCLLLGDDNIPAKAASALAEREIWQLMRLPWWVHPLGETNCRTDRAAAAPQVFISYASRDFPLAVRVCQFLEGNRLFCWIAPRNIPIGNPYPEAILSGVQASRAMIVIVSEAANLSPHVLREVELALGKRLLIMPLRVEAVSLSANLEYLFATCQWLNASENGFEYALDKLLERLASLAW